MPSRRQLLFGRFSQQTLQTGAPRPVFGEFCLPRQGVVCRSCGEACEPAAILFRPAAGGVAQPFLQVERCTGCGECRAVCPVDALRLSPASLSEEWSA